MTAPTTIKGAIGFPTQMRTSTSIQVGPADSRWRKALSVPPPNPTRDIHPYSGLKARGQAKAFSTCLRGTGSPRRDRILLIVLDALQERRSNFMHPAPRAEQRQVRKYFTVSRERLRLPSAQLLPIDTLSSPCANPSHITGFRNPRLPSQQPIPDQTIKEMENLIILID